MNDPITTPRTDALCNKLLSFGVPNPQAVETLESHAAIERELAAAQVLLRDCLPVLDDAEVDAINSANEYPEGAKYWNNQADQIQSKSAAIRAALPPLPQPPATQSQQ